MGIPRYTKKLLYEEIENLRDHIGLCPNKYPLNIKSLAIARGLRVDTHPFKTIGLRGVLAIDGDSGHIILDENRSERDQNFFCGHELMHFELHKDIGHRTFQCYEKVNEYQNSFLEWQANEGAAELAVPYHQFIPDFLDCFNPYSPDHADIDKAREQLASSYFVSEMVIKNRINNLKYEIWQVLNGTDIKDICVLSKKQQEKRGIFVSSYNSYEVYNMFSRLA